MNGSCWNVGVEAAHPGVQAAELAVPGFCAAWLYLVVQLLPFTPMGGTCLWGGGPEDRPWARITDCSVF